MPEKKIWLCLAHMSEAGEEMKFIKEAFDTNWVVPLGPNVNGFEKDLEERRTAKAAASAALPEKVKVAVHGKVYEVTVSYGDDAPAAGDKPKVAEAAGEGTEILAPLEGKAYLVQSTSETPKKVGDYVKEGDVICYIEAMKVFNRIKAEMSGTITSIRFNSGDSVAEDDVLMTIK